MFVRPMSKSQFRCRAVAKRPRAGRIRMQRGRMEEDLSLKQLFGLRHTGADEADMIALAPQ